MAAALLAPTCAWFVRADPAGTARARLWATDAESCTHQRSFVIGGMMAKAQTIETGDIFFLYTPRYARMPVRGPSDVHDIAFILSPDSNRPRRLFVLKGKSFPQPAVPQIPGGQEATAEVVDVRERPEELVDVLERRVLNVIGAPVGTIHARPCGEGRYSLSIHDNHTHLSYALELPEIPGQVQRDLGLVKDVSYVVSARGPLPTTPPSVVAKAVEFLPVSDVGVLERKGNEIRLQPGMEPDAPMAKRQPESPATAEIFGELKLTKAKHPTEPLYEGSWK